MIFAMDEPQLPPRPIDGHKGTFGTVCVIGGNACAPRVMVGGPALAALGALRVGAGLAIVAVPEPLVTTVLSIVPSATAIPLPIDQSGRLRPSDAAALLDAALPTIDVIAIGPGFGVGEQQRQIVARLLALDGPAMVVDADALNALADMALPQDAIRVPAVLTPHPGEWRRLAKALNIDGDPIDASTRPAAASALARRLGAIVVLKGARTVVSDGLREWISPHANAALATAGTGDVLTGVIAGVIAGVGEGRLRGSDDALDLFHAARLGVALHGEAASIWSQKHGEAGLLAAELAASIPEAMRRRRAGQLID